MSKRMLFAASILIILLVPAALLAQKCDMEMKGKEMACMEMCCMHGEKGLGLDPDQKLAIEKLKLEHKLANIDIKAEQMKLRKQIKEELLKDEPSRKTIDSYIKKIAANREKTQMNGIDHVMKVKKVLKPEQWKMFITHHWKNMGGDHQCRDRGMMGCCSDHMHRSKGMGMRGGCGMRHNMEGRATGGEHKTEKVKAE